NPMVRLEGPVDEGLAITYVTPRIIVVTSPLSGTDSAYRSSLNALARHLKTKHALDYRVWNVGKQRGDLARGVGTENLIEVGWPCNLAPPLDRLCAVSKSFEQWMNGAPSRVILIHSKGDPQRAAVLVSAFMHYNVICANDDSIEERFSMQRYIERHLGSTTGSPSNKRYLNYFTSLLSGKTRVNAAPVYLKKLVLTRLTGRVVCFKIYERLQPVYLTVPIKTADPQSIEVGDELRLRGDVLVKCFEDRDGKRRLLFSCQFNTCVFPRPPPLLAFFRDQLDGVFNDTSIDSQAQIEFSFGEHPPAKENGAEASSAAPGVMRTSSYEDFGTLEDGESVVEYSEILKPSSAGGAASEDSGISVEDFKLSLNFSGRSVASPRQSSSCSQEAAVLPPPLLPRIDVNGSERGMGPPVPPKPGSRPASAMAEITPNYEMPERRGILPASVKPLVARPPSPKEMNPRMNSVTPSIEPDLVGKDRYDKASKCFSYAPTKDLKQAFDRPRKKSFSLHSEEEALAVRPDEISSVVLRSTDIPRMPEEPKWTDEVDKRQAAEEDRFRRELANRPVPPLRSHSSIGDAYPRRRWGGQEETEERPQVVDLARKASSGSTFGSMRRKPKYGSYRTLNDDYNSDMDDLCDPDFYLNYNQPANQPYRSQSTVPHGAKSAELPRKQFGRARNDSSDPLEDLLSYNQSSVARPMPAASLLDLNEDRDNFRQRNCRSVSHAPPKQTYKEKMNSPFFRDRRLFSDRYDALSEAAPTEDWLDTKLKKLRSKRGNDPELVQRKKQERMLLEELKNAHDDREAARGRRELDYSTEGVGTRQEPIDPLADYRREEERLRNTNSPFDLDSSRRTPKPLRSKPPTPPPRERSRSPTSRINTPSVDIQHASNGGYGTYGGGYGNGGRRGGDYGRTSEVYGNDRQPASTVANGYGRRGEEEEEEYDGEFSTLRSIMQPQQHSRSDSRPILKQSTVSRAGYNTLDFSQRSHTPTHFLSGQERVANAILRAETPTQQFNQYFPAHTLDRSETPAFPLSMRETPLPFHPLLYASQNNLTGNGGPPGHSQTLNYRSASPRSQYYGGGGNGGFSRRSSMNSIATFVGAREASVSLASSESSSTCSSSSSSPTTSSRRAIVASPIFGRRPAPPATEAAAPAAAERPASATGSEASSSKENQQQQQPAAAASKLTPATTPKSPSNSSSNGIIVRPTNQTDVVNHHPIFVKDTSKYWYKPHISREQAISILRDKQPGTFVIRDSNSFPGAFGLALKVAQPPPGVAPGDGTELVRHFLIEPSPKGVKLKGCNNEPVFGTLSALVYQHSMTPLALPCKLLLPEFDPATTAESISATQALLEQGAACNVTYVGSVDCESLTGAECVRRSVQRILDDLARGEAMPVSAHFKVSSQGVTLTDNTRKSFFRRHYPVNSVIFAGIDPAERRFDNTRVVGFTHGAVDSARLFAFVARKFDRAENACHVFAEFESEQPASAVVNFINKVMLAQRRRD
ncbi:hypothetical protein PENTCL1PPCAC_22153, partial [Pristionchus entomophagus]